MCRAQGRRCPHSSTVDGRQAAALRVKLRRRPVAAAKFRAALTAAHGPSADEVDLFAAPGGPFRDVRDGLDADTVVWVRVPRAQVDRTDRGWVVPSHLTGEAQTMRSCGECGRWDTSPHRCRLKPLTAPSTVDGDRFPGSVIRDASGALTPMYHGSSVAFDVFDAEFTGAGNDAWGSGFYFTDNNSQARGYGEHVKTVHLDVRNPIRVDGTKFFHLGESVRFTAQQSAQLLRAHPDIYRQPNDEDNTNPLGDYAHKFWDKDEWTRPEFDRMIDGMAREYFDDADWSTVEALFEGGSSQHFRRAVTEVTGHDGVTVDFGEDGVFCIAWQPEQIHVTESS